jgi:hypothetical protein
VFGRATEPNKGLQPTPYSLRSWRRSGFQQQVSASVRRRRLEGETMFDKLVEKALVPKNSRKKEENDGNNVR